jgi:hypothetical protein
VSTLRAIFRHGAQVTTDRFGVHHLQQRQDHLTDDESIARFIAQKWNLTTPHAINLLMRQFTRMYDYDASKDFLVFHHIAKTGGTSISDILESIFRDAVMPGSARSNSFNEKEFHTTILERARNQTDGIGPFPEYRVSYGHTRLRPIHGPNKTNLALFFENYNTLLAKPKRLRSLAMIREPTDLRASAHAMAMCALNGKVNTYNYWREKRNQTRVCTKEEGLDIQKLVEDYHDKVLRTKCNKTATETLDRFEKKICTKGPASMAYCLSPSHLLSSPAYGGLRSMYKSLMCRYFAQQPFMTNYIGIERFMSRAIGKFDVKKVEEYALVDLGGLDSVSYDSYDMEGFLSSSSRNDTTKPAFTEPDFLWFGITERMAESTCLLFHALNVKPIAVPRARVVNCSPTSWWTQRHRDEVKKREPGDYAVWRAANAILDVRIESMQRDIRDKLRDKRLSVENRERLDAFIEAGCLAFGYGECSQ